MIKSRKGLFIKVVAYIFIVVMIWFSAAVIDHSLVFEQEKEPLFCIRFTVKDNVRSYYGIGYYYLIVEENGRFVEIDFENFLHANEYLVVSKEARENAVKNPPLA